MNLCRLCKNRICDCMEGEVCERCSSGSGLCLDCEIELAYEEYQREHQFVRSRSHGRYYFRHGYGERD